jgi:hypothetical protein
MLELSELLRYGASVKASDLFIKEKHATDVARARQDSADGHAPAHCG